MFHTAATAIGDSLQAQQKLIDYLKLNSCYFRTYGFAITPAVFFAFVTSTGATTIATFVYANLQG
jgi:hypothetical protein